MLLLRAQILTSFSRHSSADYRCVALEATTTVTCGSTDTHDSKTNNASWKDKIRHFSLQLAFALMSDSMEDVRIAYDFMFVVCVCFFFFCFFVFMH